MICFHHMSIKMQVPKTQICLESRIPMLTVQLRSYVVLVLAIQLGGKEVISLGLKCILGRLNVLIFLLIFTPIGRKPAIKWISFIRLTGLKLLHVAFFHNSFGQFLWWPLGKLDVCCCTYPYSERWKRFGDSRKSSFWSVVEIFCCFIENILREKVEFRLQYWKILCFMIFQGLMVHCKASFSFEILLERLLNLLEGPLITFPAQINLVFTTPEKLAHGFLRPQYRCGW